MLAVISDSCDHSVDTLVIGAGHAGLAASYCLSQRSINHVVLERGEVANSWRHERWDSLKLFTPNWQAQLPGYGYSGDDPDGFMDVKDVIDFIDEYAVRSKAPIQTSTTVISVTKTETGYRVHTNRGSWSCRSIVIASGACNSPVIPKLSESLPNNIKQLTAKDYRNTTQLKKGAVIVVGASATGLQLSEEISRAGHRVTLATGEHVRLPRLYRGKDIQWWMHETGLLDEGLDVIDDINRARRLPSPQLVGSHKRDILDLNTLTGLGIKLVGRLMAVNNGDAQFSGSLANVCALADLKMNRLLKAIDQWAEETGRSGEFEPPQRFEATRVDESPGLVLNFEMEDVQNVIWATGYRPDYSWLNVPVLDKKGWIKHQGGVADAPGMYVLGMPFLRCRKSSYIHGIEDDARFVTEHLNNYLNKENDNGLY
jgi:putative flavoprotein involved in K+ transport